MLQLIRKYVAAGLLVILPIWATISVIQMMLDTFDDIIQKIPTQYQPATLLGYDVPGLGIITILALILLVGMLATNVVGSYLVSAYEWVLDRIPFVRSVYSGVKQATDVVFNDREQAFSRVVMVEFPRRDMRSLAFVTSRETAHVSTHLPDDCVMVFVPTTPNPTSGFLMLLSEKDTIPVDLTIEDAMKILLSMGTVMGGNGNVVPPTSK